MRGDSGVAGEGRVVGIPKFHSWGKYTMPLTNINSDWMSNASSGLCIIYLFIYIIGTSPSEPHTCGENGKLSICIYNICMYICLVRTYSVYIHPAQCLKLLEVATSPFRCKGMIQPLLL